MALGLKKTATQQADLEQLLNDLQDRKSPAYHRWLTPEQYADRFGISQNDVDKIASWLTMSGFQVLNVSRGRDMIMFSGTAAQVQQSLGTPIHFYRVNGTVHFANASEAQIPGELAGMVIGIRGLNDFRPKPHVGHSRTLRANLTKGERPQAIDSQGDTVLVPDDVKTIYDLNPIYKAGWDGTGQTIAIAGQSDIDPTDIEAFRQALNLPPNDPTRILVPNYQNPGTNPDAMLEADMDLEWAGAMAPGAQIQYVFSPDMLASAFYAIDQALAPVLSYSAGECEWAVDYNSAGLYLTYAQRAAAEGITWVASSGDSGAAGCENQNGSSSIAITRMSVSLPASLPEVTGVGGTEFNEGSGIYWASVPGPNYGTALSYIPEVAWNDEQQALQSGGFAASGGGVSRFWAKPMWQTGPGVPGDSGRDVPDVALSASWDHDPYFLYSGGVAQLNGGTSAAAPTFAGMLVLLNQYLVGENLQPQPGLGNMNPMLYFLGQNYRDVYHDAIGGGNWVYCMAGSSQDCPESGANSDGINVYGFSAGPGYDQASGWGSVDATRLLVTWANVVSGTPKLVITDFSTSAQASRGGQFNFTLTFSNLGDAPAGAFQVRILLTTDGTAATAKPWYIDCNYPSGAGAGQELYCHGPVTMGLNVTAGTYIPLAIVDYNDQVLQYDRTGNYAHASNGTVKVQ
jgi:subtilase family serine protease